MIINELKEKCASHPSIAYIRCDEISGGCGKREDPPSISSCGSLEHLPQSCGIDESSYDESICASTTECKSATSNTAHNRDGGLIVVNRSYDMLRSSKTSPQPPNSLYDNVPNITGPDILHFAKQIANGMVGSL